MSAENAKKGMKGKGAIKKGLQNLTKHLENLALFGVPVVIALNKFPNDKDDEIDIVERFCEGMPFAVAEVWEKGGEGGIELAGKVVDTLYNTKSNFRYLYELEMPVKKKIEIIAKKIYGAGKVVYTLSAEDDIRIIHKLRLEGLPICMAKTPYSLTDDPKIYGRPKNFKVTIKEIRISASAGFLVPITGKITTMPGLPAHPTAEKMDIDKNGEISGLF